jgi:PTS hybrid protein
MAAKVGIVLVSHSASLAEGTAELAGQVGGGAVTIATAGGTDDGRLGTSIDKVSSAIRRADTGAGVVILPDLGSSVLTVRSPPRSPPPRAAASRPSSTPRRRHAMPENCEATVTLTGDLHARPAGALSVAAAGFSSTVQLTVGGGASVDAKSVLSVMQLGASSGQEVTVRAVGPDAQEAVDTLIGILSTATKVGD